MKDHKMYDQNPLLHKLTVDDLARVHQRDPLGRQTEGPARRRSAALAAAFTVLAAAVIVMGADIV
jgi:hypothetical protein